MPDAGDVCLVDFPGVTGVKRRPVVVLSSPLYHSTRPDVIVGLITSQVASATAPTDYVLQEWAAAGLRVQSAFRCFLVTVPPGSNLSKIGSLSETDWAEVRARVRSALASLD